MDRSHNLQLFNAEVSAGGGFNCIGFLILEFRVGTLANGGHFSEEWALWAIDELGFFGVSCVRTFFKDEKRGRLSILGIMDVGISGLRDGFVHQLV